MNGANARLGHGAERREDSRSLSPECARLQHESRGGAPPDSRGGSRRGFRCGSLHVCRLGSSIIACLATMTAPAGAAPDELLAQTFGRAVVSSPELDPSSRESLSRAAMEAAMPLPSRPEADAARLGSDLAALIRCRAWPFNVAGRESSGEGREWLADAVRHLVSKAGSSRLPTDQELAESKAMPSRVVAVLRDLIHELHPEWSQESRQEVIDAARRVVRARAPLFGNAFVPELLRPCPATGVGGADPLESALLERLLRSPESGLARLSIEPDPDQDPEWAEAEARALVARAMSALLEIARECHRTDAEGWTPPTPLLERELALQAREKEVRDDDRAGRASAITFHAEPGATDAGEAPPAAPPARPAGEFTHDDAMAKVFEGSGILVIHGTAILPRAWSRSSGAPRIDWRTIAIEPVTPTTPPK